MIVITAKKDGFRRAGIAHPARATAHADDSITAEQLEMLQAERGASKNTLLAYAADLADLQSFLSRRKQGPLTADATALRAYLKSLDYVGMTPRTVARRTRWCSSGTSWRRLEPTMTMA